jgi:hypothetical protein
MTKHITGTRDCRGSQRAPAVAARSRVDANPATLVTPHVLFSRVKFVSGSRSTDHIENGTNVISTKRSQGDDDTEDSNT